MSDLASALRAVLPLVKVRTHAKSASGLDEDVEVTFTECYTCSRPISNIAAQCWATVIGTPAGLLWLKRAVAHCKGMEHWHMTDYPVFAQAVKGARRCSACHMFSLSPKGGHCQRCVYQPHTRPGNTVVELDAEDLEDDRGPRGTKAEAPVYASACAACGAKAPDESKTPWFCDTCDSVTEEATSVDERETTA